MKRWLHVVDQSENPCANRSVVCARIVCCSVERQVSRGRQVRRLTAAQTTNRQQRSLPPSSQQHRRRRHHLRRNRGQRRRDQLKSRALSVADCSLDKQTMDWLVVDKAALAPSSIENNVTDIEAMRSITISSVFVTAMCWFLASCLNVARCGLNEVTNVQFVSWKNTALQWTESRVRRWCSNSNIWRLCKIRGSKGAFHYAVSVHLLSFLWVMTPKSRYISGSSFITNYFSITTIPVFNTSSVLSFLRSTYCFAVIVSNT